MRANIKRIMWCLSCHREEEIQIYDYKLYFTCACNICGDEFSSMHTLIEHLGGHELKCMNRYIVRGLGTVKCLQCDRIFDNVYKMATVNDHRCIQSPESIVILVP